MTREKRNRSRWGVHHIGERLPDYRVAVTEATRHGRAKRHIFVLDDSEPACWLIEPDISKIYDRAHKAGYGGKDNPIGNEWGLERVPLPSPISLAAGVDLQSDVLAVILDALVSKGRHDIDLGDLKVVISQLGSRLAAFIRLPSETRQTAQPALYAQILKLCTNM